MLDLSPETEALALRLAAAQSRSVEDTIRPMLEERARTVGVLAEPLRPRRRLSADAMLAVGAEIAAMPVLDRRSPREIMDDVNFP